MEAHKARRGQAGGGPLRQAGGGRQRRRPAPQLNLGTTIICTFLNKLNTYVSDDSPYIYMDGFLSMCFGTFGQSNKSQNLQLSELAGLVGKTLFGPVRISCPT